jgi:uncharacterized protein YggE
MTFSIKSGALICALLLFVSTIGVEMANGQENSQSNEKTRTVSVSGEGKVAAEPDQATVQFSVVTRHEDPEAARAANAEASALALRQIRDAGVDEEDIEMQHLSLNPAREWDPEKRKHIDVGFEVNRSVSVEVDDLSLVPTLVARIVQSGANRIGGVQYGLSNDGEIRSEALSRAVANARAKARVMVAELGESLGRVISIHEQSVQVPMPVMRSLAMSPSAEKAADPNPEAYAPGSIEVTAQVSATFAIED